MIRKHSRKRRIADDVDRSSWWSGVARKKLKVENSRKTTNSHPSYTTTTTTFANVFAAEELVTNLGEIGTMDNKKVGNNKKIELKKEKNAGTASQAGDLVNLCKEQMRKAKEGEEKIMEEWDIEEVAQLEEEITSISGVVDDMRKNLNEGDRKIADDLIKKFGSANGACGRMPRNTNKAVLLYIAKAKIAEQTGAALERIRELGKDKEKWEALLSAEIEKQEDINKLLAATEKGKEVCIQKFNKA